MFIEKTLGQLCELGRGKIQTGPFGSQLHQADYSEEGTPVVMPADIIDGKISEAKIARVSEDHVMRLERHQLAIGDIVYGRRGDIGRQALVTSKEEGWLCGTGCLRVTVGKNSLIDPEYLHLYLKMPDVISYIQNQAIGATMPNLNTEILKRIPIRYPEKIADQKKVIAVLKAYFDLIENNKKRIQILENMAEELYKEWFVRFRFPNWENTEFEKGIPKDWNTLKMSEIVSYYIGGGWGEEEQNLEFSEEAYVIRGTDIPKFNEMKFSEKVLRFHKPSNLKSRVLQAYDLIFEVSGGSKDQLLGRNLMITPNLLNIFENKVICASFCKLIRFDLNKVNPFFMKYFMKLYYKYDLVGLYQVQSTGISNYQFESFLKHQTIQVPTKPLTDQFEKIVKPLVEQMENLGLQNELLVSTRDNLLPRLISGKLSVENLDIQFPPSMQEQ
ncbi:restriction endonuclease subunit S [Acinetobacter junii]|uniref:restriction endonuclease subunit S n=1 Tax=Acinetobacter junii TaxID=40215 RepID=UPI000F7ED75F|nr:restriction endonuclease subunit S [Acinetobacter junii]RTE44794.1 restriction endonuclease subunit S [Acinetobacter junii]VTX91280.1 Type I restriction modification DNA specificity domain protein [Acinetobacter junii]